jgi:hypothetical protein
VIEVVLPILGEDGVPVLAPPADAGKSAGLKCTRRELVAPIWPFAVRAAVGDPPQDVGLPVGQRLAARHVQRSTTKICHGGQTERSSGGAYCPKRQAMARMTPEQREQSALLRARQAAQAAEEDDRRTEERRQQWRREGTYMSRAR